MKIKDIVVPGDYYLAYNQKVHIVAVETRKRRVYSGARWDMRGHESTGKVAVDDRGNLYTPAQILGPWADKERELTTREEQIAAQDEAIKALKDAIGTGYAVDYGYDFGKYERRPGVVKITMSTARAQELAERLAV